MIKTIYKRFDLLVKGANQTFSGTFEFDKSIVALKGVLIDSDRPDLILFRGSQRLEINRDEIVPENYMTRRWMSGLNTNVNTRYRDLKSMHPGNGIVKLDFKDSDSFGTNFTPYTVILEFECEMDDAK
ncbi:MAG: hypothetical protein HY063_10975 [Bacteroidetes bacterium]|nr:hypothetical protein [Bacteroidota bacterium]